MLFYQPQLTPKNMYFFSTPFAKTSSINLLLATNAIKDAGVHQTRLDASRLNSGIYFIRLVMENQVLTEKVVLQR